MRGPSDSIGPPTQQTLPTVRIALTVLLAFCSDIASAADPLPAIAPLINFSDTLPFDQAPLAYSSPATDDAVARLARQWNAGAASLEFDPSRGYLRSLLRALDIPVESQLLVYSKTALHADLVGPKSPRAIYFGDDDFVAWVPGAMTIEIAAHVPHKGAMFYSLSNADDAPPRITRQQQCLSCHVDRTTRGVPGHMLRAFVTDADGRPTGGGEAVSHDTPYADRFAGWFVSGAPAFFPKLEPRTPSVEFDFASAAAPNYLAETSDIAALLVLQHQVEGLNLLTRVGYEARLRRHSDAVDRLVRYLLFTDEPPLPAPITPGSKFAAVYAARGPFDSRGRSLRRLDLNTRLFRYRLSPLVHSRAFDALPGETRNHVYARLWSALNAADDAGPAAHIPSEERRAIIDVVRDTKSNLPAEWRR